MNVEKRRLFNAKGLPPEIPQNFRAATGVARNHFPPQTQAFVEENADLTYMPSNLIKNKDGAHPLNTAPGLCQYSELFIKSRRERYKVRDDVVDLSETYSNNYSIIREYVKGFKPMVSLLPPPSKRSLSKIRSRW